MPRQEITAVIPARYASVRFPGKLLQPILGSSVLKRTYESVKKCPQIDKIFIATDDERIAHHAQQFGAKALMTTPTCATGTDRIVEAICNHQELFAETDIVVNVQGDEPCIGSENITALIETLRKYPHEMMTTVVTPINDPADILSPSVVKCVFDRNHHALYFSRSPIPGLKPGVEKEYFSSPTPSFFKHVGIYAFRKDFLLRYSAIEMTPLQQLEDLEQLKVLESGYKIKVVEGLANTPNVDIPEDIQKVTEWLCNQNISL
jgi:3-deoxy-manno-octulosonate cytidylyltransferase (CMP-KDO synthetase)